MNVRIYTNDYWRPLVVEAVKGVEAAMPARGPRLRIIHSPELPCAAVKALTFRKPTITVCSLEIAGYAGSAQIDGPAHHVISGERAWLTVVGGPAWGLAFNRNTACHEMMHAVSWVNDNYDYPHDSCVQGGWTTPGPWDVAFLHHVYTRHDTKAKQRRIEKREERQQERKRHHSGRRGGKQGGRK